MKSDKIRLKLAKILTENPEITEQIVEKMKEKYRLDISADEIIKALITQAYK